MLQQFSLIFYYLCLFTSFITSLWCVFEYRKDKDITEISYQKFDSKKPRSQYPSMSIMLLNPYKEDIILQYNDANINVSSYQQFLKGALWYDKMMSVDYKLSTIEINEKMIGSCITTMTSKNCIKIDKVESLSVVTPLGVFKCFSVSFIHDSPLDEVFLAINNSLFPNGVRPPQSQFMVAFNYPHEIARSIITSLSDWPILNDANGDYHVMKFYLSNVEILKRRRDGAQRCYDWEIFDSQTIEDVMLSVGCQPPFWSTKKIHETCNSSQQLMNIGQQYWAKMFQDNTFQTYIPPCEEVQKIDIMYQEATGDEVRNEFNNEIFDEFEREAGTKKGWFVMNIHFWKSTHFKEILQVKAYSVQSVFGNAGGYIGLLVGITISDFPSFIFRMYQLFQRRYN